MVQEVSKLNLMNMDETLSDLPKPAEDLLERNMEDVLEAKFKQNMEMLAGENFMEE